MQPAVEEGPRPLVRVEEQHEPGGSVGGVGEFGEEDGCEDALGRQHQLYVLLVAEAGTQPRTQPVGSLGELGRVDGSGERAYAGHETQPDESRAGGGHAGCRGLGSERVAGLHDRRLGLVPPLPMRGQQPVEFLEPMPLPCEPVADGRHRLGHTARTLVDVGGQRPALPRKLLQLPYEEGLSDPRVAVHVEQEPVPLVLRRQFEVLPERGALRTPPDEPAPRAARDQLPHRGPRPHHPPVSSAIACPDRLQSGPTHLKRHGC